VPVPGRGTLLPYGLFFLIAVASTTGAGRIAAYGAVVQQVNAVESVSNVDVVCTDKTGTLTTGVMALDATVDADGAASAQVLRLAYLNAALETGIENPLDAALVAAGRQAGLATAGCAKIDEIPYDFVRKRLTIVMAEADDPEVHRIVMKGAVAGYVIPPPLAEATPRAQPAAEPVSTKRGATKKKSSSKAVKAG